MMMGDGAGDGLTLIDDNPNAVDRRPNKGG